MWVERVANDQSVLFDSGRDNAFAKHEIKCKKRTFKFAPEKEEEKIY